MTQTPADPEVQMAPVSTTALTVFASDIRAARICFQGARPWFQRHGLSWQDFLANGIDADLLEASGDALALRVTNAARARATRGSGQKLAERPQKAPAEDFAIPVKPLAT